MRESRRYHPNSELVNDELCAFDLGAATSLGVDSFSWNCLRINHGWIARA